MLKAKPSLIFPSIFCPDLQGVEQLAWLWFGMPKTPQNYNKRTGYVNVGMAFVHTCLADRRLNMIYAAARFAHSQQCL
jgi:hypothetical protein